MAKKTRCVKVRFTEEDFTSLKRRAASHRNVSQYIRMAVAEFSDTTAAERIEVINQLTTDYEKYHSTLFHAAANLNQAMKRANELRSAGLLTASYYNSAVMPKIAELTEALFETRGLIEELYKKILK